MKTEDKSEETTKSIELKCCAGEAAEVFVAGTFNDWNADTIPLEKLDDGDWVTSLQLEPGYYEFKFIVDGQWCCEAGCEGEFHGCSKCVPNDCGTMNRVLEVA